MERMPLHAAEVIVLWGWTFTLGLDQFPSLMVMGHM